MVVAVVIAAAAAAAAAAAETGPNSLAPVSVAVAATKIV